MNMACGKGCTPTLRLIHHVLFSMLRSKQHVFQTVLLRRFGVLFNYQKSDRARIPRNDFAFPLPHQLALPVILISYAALSVHETCVCIMA
jgi:hypothetical protein